MATTALVVSNQATKKFYTAREDKIILKWIDKYPQNLSEAFERAAEELDKTPASISGRWYSLKKKKETPTVVVVASKTSQINSNIKNTPRQITLPSGEVRIQDVMKDVIRMTRNEQDILRQYLNAAARK